ELRKTVLFNETGEQKVEVNQRNLIDKVLARYSAEFVIYRELMQNSDDAQAKTVQITFETDKSKKCRRIIFKNNGFLFRDEDWNRLKKIAEGNPDVEKIGAFGVGFYSLFSICEEPFISSGTQGMAFYWRNDQLFSKMGGIKQDDMIWTTFLMDTRRKENLPNIGYFGRFLATSLGFTRNLRKVIVYFNDTEVIHLTKETNKSLSINMDIGLNKFSPKNMFQLKSVDVCNVRLHFRGLIGPEKSQISQSTSLKIACGNLGVDVSKSFSEEMEFATKKKPPNNTTIQMIFTGHDERNLPGNSNKEILNIFKDLTPFPDQGRIFIGFPTHQTTGCSVHLAARVIPTVERESIDLVHKTLSVYNKEMLCSAGILARIVYDDEMNQISRLCMDIDPKLLNSDDKQDKKGFEYLQECSVHILQHFTFKTSTPNNMVAKIIESQFFDCTKKSLQILSTHKAKTVQIKFETDKLKKCGRIIFKNNGFLFRDEDWNRLKKIAEGNPDVEKIGAFGVGFYSLFSICEEPFISSGTQGMAFYWRNDQLFSRMGDIKQDDMIWTTFLMDTRRKENLPNIGSFGRFLATSLGFTRNLRNVIVYFNDTEVIHLTKETNKSLSINMDIGLNKFSPKNMFQLKSVDVCNVRLHFRGLIGPEKSQISQSTSLKIACGNLGVDVSKSFSEEMEFATKKKPPNNTTIQMIFTGHDERNLPGNSNKEILNIFKDLTPFPDQGRIFIGFPTHQTTGCSVHLAARVIPTVERESIDLVHKTLSVYNKEMLCSAGILARIVYDDEMNQISRLCMDIDPKLLNSDDKQDKKSFEYLQECSVHILQHFTFKTSTPNNMVAKIIESQFFDCTKKSLQILSTHGVLPINSVRVPNKEVVSFIKTIPMVPFSLFTECSEFFTIAKDILKCISEISMDDVFEELKRRQFNNKELSDLFKWWIGYRSKNDITDEQFRKFMCLVSIGDDLTPLNHIRYFLNPHVIPPTIEVPPDVLPYSISKPLRKEDLEAHFGDWTELTILTWTQYIFTKPGIDDPDFAEKILKIISHQFKNLSKSDLEAIKKIMAEKRCIPTVSGMKLPKESYFPDVKLLPDLPNVNLKQHKIKNTDEFLLFIGVKKHVELQLVFDRLFNKGSWDHMELIKYLASIDLEYDDIEKLKTSVIWPIEFGNKTQKFTAKELYAPLPKLIELRLPIIKWKGRFYKNTKEGKFILKLGLREYPPLDEILKLASNPPIRQKAFEYFLDNFRDKYAKDYDARSINVPFLPCMDPNVYSEPSKCFFNPECAIMGFNVLRKDLRCRAEELGVEQYPNYLQLSDKLIKEPPENEEKAKLVFEFLFSCTSSSDSTAFSKLKFIPTRDKDLPNTFKYNLPQDCFFKNSEEESIELIDFFHYVDFGDKANVFLRNCGVKDKPSPSQLAEFLVNSSDAFLEKIDGNKNKYISILHKIAIDFSSIKKNSELLFKMKQERILLGRNNDEADNEKYKLARAKDIYINDNSFYTVMFKPLTCPIDALLEGLYRSLGSYSLDSSVTSSFVTIGTPELTGKSQAVQVLIRERFPLFYYNKEPYKIKFPENSMKELNVMEVEDIKGTYYFNEKTKFDSKICKIESNKEKRKFTIYFKCDEGEPDLFGIAAEISQHIYEKPEPQDTSHISILLMTPLNALKKNGYPVDRMLEERTKNTIKIPTATMRNQEEWDFGLFQNPFYINPPWKMLGSGSDPIHCSKEYLREALRNGVSSCCPNSRAVIDFQTGLNVDREPEKNHCDISQGQPLKRVRVINEINIYILKKLVESKVLTYARLKSIGNFIKILKDLCEVFELNPKTINIFYDPEVDMIAFNSAKSLFFNLEFYISLHDSNGQPPSADVMFYWFMSMCHELAHNFVYAHNSDHEYYLSSYCRTYFDKFLTKLDKLKMISCRK
ncbi:15951_t:CDS:10, partial [Entrophospora sp. SA101]